MGGFRILEHTADMGIEATAESLAELLVQAARALMEIISGEEGAAKEQRRVELAAEDAGELMVNWLNEILFLFESKGFFPAEFAIEEATEKRILARVGGEPFDPGRHPVEREVKAATYYRLRVAKEGEQWRARVYLDL